MSALLGTIHLEKGPIDRPFFLGLSERLGIRQPVHCETLITGHVALAVLTDVSLCDVDCSQPFNAGHFSFVGDVRLYNRRELLQNLGLSLGSERRESDSELVFKAFLEFGSEFLTHINGDFGFVVYDHHQQAIQLFRDHIGARPLFWTRAGEQLMFSTFCDHLCALQNQVATLNDDRIANYLYSPNEPRNDSFLAGVHSVPPGMSVTITRDKTTFERWWDPRSFITDESWVLQEAQEELRCLFSEAVSSRLPAVGVVGTHVSGGIDSSVVSAEVFNLASRETSKSIIAYTWSPEISDSYPDLGPLDERHRIEGLCKPMEVPIRYGLADSLSFEALLQEPMEHQGVADLASELVMSRKIEEDGVRVVLSGWGGDELLSGHGLGYFAWLMKSGQWGAGIKILRHRAGGFRQWQHCVNYFWGHGVVPMLPDRLYCHFSPFTDLFSTGAFPSKAMAETYKEMSTQDKSSPIRLIADPMMYLHRVLLKGYLGERMATWAAWSNTRGFEYRYPLTDRRLMEHLLSLPPRLLFGDGRSRSLAHQTFADYLLPYTSKTEITHDQFRRDNRARWLSQLRADVNNGRLDAGCPYLDISELKAAIAQSTSAKSSAQLANFARILVAMRVFEMYRRHA